MRRKPLVVVLTNHDSPEYQAAALDLGVAEFLDKRPGHFAKWCAERRWKRSRIHFRRRALTTFGTWAMRPSARDNCGRPVMEIPICMCATPSRLSVSVRMS